MIAIWMCSHMNRKPTAATKYIQNVVNILVKPSGQTQHEDNVSKYGHDRCCLNAQWSQRQCDSQAEHSEDTTWHMLSTYGLVGNSSGFGDGGSRRFLSSACTVASTLATAFAHASGSSSRLLDMSTFWRHCTHTGKTSRSHRNLPAKSWGDVVLYRCTRNQKDSQNWQSFLHVSYMLSYISWFTVILWCKLWMLETMLHSYIFLTLHGLLLICD